MPNRQIVGGEPYRYAYQGQEKDPETGKEAFQLRLWDSRIGRWLTTDPAGQYDSPYLGMGNNPIRSIDPDGGTATDWYEGEDGRVVWFDNTTESFANSDGNWKNVGATLSDVANHYGIKTQTNFTFTDLESILIVRGGVMVPSVPAPITTDASLGFSFNLKNAGEYGFDRIDGQTEITGVNASLNLISTNNFPGNIFPSIGGNFEIFSRPSTPLDPSPYRYQSNNFSMLPYPVLTNAANYATGSASVNIPLNRFMKYYTVHNSIQRDLNINANIIMKFPNIDNKVRTFNISSGVATYPFKRF